MANKDNPSRQAAAGSAADPGDLRPSAGDDAQPTVMGIGRGWQAELARVPSGARLTIRRGASDRNLEIVISLEDSGPILRAKAAAVEIETEADLTARCERFRVEARQSVELVSGGDLKAQARRIGIEATHGSARLQANDDVQLLGENVLLNCERSLPSPPAWALHAPVPPAPVLAAAETSGEPAVLDDLEKDIP
jgi:hypothetical protein